MNLLRVHDLVPCHRCRLRMIKIKGCASDCCKKAWPEAQDERSDVPSPVVAELCAATSAMLPVPYSPATIGRAPKLKQMISCILNKDKRSNPYVTHLETKCSGVGSMRRRITLVTFYCKCESSLLL